MIALAKQQTMEPETAPLLTLVYGLLSRRPRIAAELFRTVILMLTRPSIASRSSLSIMEVKLSGSPEAGLRRKQCDAKHLRASSCRLITRM